MKSFRWILLETQRTSFPEEINALRNQKPPASNSRISSLSPFRDRQGLLRNWRNISALSKLPADVRLNWNRHVLSQNIEDPSFRNFAPWLQKFATACRDSFIPFSDTNHNGRSSSSTNARAQGHNSKTPFVKPSFQSSLYPEKKGCVYLGSCKHFKAFSPIDRKNYAKKYHLCFNCLKGQNFNDCKSTKVCQHPGCMKKNTTPCSIMTDKVKIKFNLPHCPLCGC